MRCIAMEEIVFPNQIRINRKMRGVSMQDLADRLGISLSAISKIEKGYRRLNQEQLILVAEVLDCSLQDLYVNEQNSQHEVVMAWKKEQERRQEINKSSGLKVLGAALRYIRNEKSLTLIEVAENADMTLSVYHRIEMGQREVSDKEYKSIAKALGMEVWVYTSKPKKSLPKKYQKVTLNELFSACDVVSLHCPLTAENKEMVNSFRLSLMKQGAILINTSRGGLIDEKALEQALLSGKLLGAGLDVLSSEPVPNGNPLLKLKNCFITPHIAWATRESRMRLMNQAVENLKAWMEGRTINNVLEI